MLAGVARRLKRGIDDGEDAFSVFMSCQDHVIATARAHVEREVLDAFARQVERCEDPAPAAHLGRMCDLFALTTIENDRGWFLEHGRLSAARSKAVTRTVNQLLAEVREHAGALVDAFGIPQEALRSPLAERRG
jgi:acyl-CoA oxidase